MDVVHCYRRARRRPIRIRVICTCAILVPLLLIAEARAGAELRRRSVELRGGILVDRSDIPGGMLRKDGAPGNPVLTWGESEQIEIGVAYEITKSFVLDLSVGRADFDLGTDVHDLDSEGFTHVPIATGDLQSLRLSAWFQLDGEHIFARDSTRRGRWMAGLTLGRLSAEDVEIDRAGMKRLGVESVTAGNETVYGFGARGDLRLGRSGWALGFESCIMWSSGGSLVEVQTTENSPYSSADVTYAPYTITAFAGYHF